MASIQQSLNNMFATTLGATFTALQTPAVKDTLAVRDAKKSLKTSSEEAQAIYQKDPGLSKEKSELLSGVAARQSEDMEKLASLAKSGEEAAKYREKAQYLKQASEGYQNLAQRQKTRPERRQEQMRAYNAANAAQRQAEAQKSKEEVARAVEIRRAIVQGLPSERQEEIMKETENG